MRNSSLALAALISCAGGGAVTGPVLTIGWTALQPMPAPIGEAAIAALDGKVYVAGGYNTSRQLQIYDPASNTWDSSSQLPRGTDNAGAIAAGGKLYVFGGEDSNSMQIFDPSAKSWTQGPILPDSRFSSVVEVIGDKVHLVGGWSFDRADNVSIASHAVFSLTTRQFLPNAAPLQHPRNHAYSGVIGGKLYVAGGRAPGHEADGSNIAESEVYDPATDSWSPFAPLPTPRSGGAAAVLDGKLYVLGGGLPGNILYKAIDRFDPVTGQWQTLDEMPFPATGHRAVAVAGSLYVVGGFLTRDGQRAGFSGMAGAYKYTPP